MFIFTEPFVSDLAKDFIKNIDNNRVVSNTFLNTQLPCSTQQFLSEEEAVKKLLAADGRWLYSNSEHALTWLDEKLPQSHRLRKCIELFKNKLLFRQTYAPIFPDIKFRELPLDKLLRYKFKDFGESFIIKPTVGFLSAGVYRINSQSELTEVQSKLLTELAETEKIFPKSVLNSSSFLLEGIIEGREFAIDAYFSENNKPVIINIFEHKFRDHADMSDRLYVTSRKIITRWLEPFTEFLNKLQTNIDLGGFALHAEVRVNNDGIINPIEVNPLRFAGWCTTDLCYWAYGINPYELFAKRAEPAWDEIISTDDEKIYGMSVLSTSNVSKITNFNYDRLAKEFSDLKELRKVDYKVFPLMGFAFFAIEEDDKKFSEWLLHSDFSEFCK